MSRVVVLAATFTMLSLISAAPASAHEERKVGRWHFDVGWEIEPTYAGYPNAVHLGLGDAKEKPVADLGDTLKVDVTFGGQSTTVSLDPNFEKGEFGEVGNFKADIIPTRPGTYAFHITGTIKGDKIDQTFTCGERTFDCVKDPTELEFPVKDPSNSQLASRIDQEAKRLAARTADAKDKASLGQTLGYIGIGVGAVALIVGLARRRIRATQG